MQECQPFGQDLHEENIDARHIAARPGEVGDKTKLNRVFTDTEDDRDACCRSFGCERGSGANRGDHGHLSADGEINAAFATFTKRASGRC